MLSSCILKKGRIINGVFSLLLFKEMNRINHFAAI